MTRVRLLLALALLALAACAGPAATPGTGGGPGQPAPPAAGPRRLVAAMKTVPPSFYQRLNPSNVSGGPEVSDLVSVGLTTVDDQGRLIARLAEAVPSAENGQWVVDADGRMQTTWRLRPTATWHDGAPVTAADLLFTAQVVQDRDLAVFRENGYELIESVTAADDRTVTVAWKQPFTGADTMFGAIAVPMPRHLLEPPYLADKSTFTELPLWSQDFVGAGPFKVRELVRGSHVVLQAHEGYALGRPKLDEVEVRFITDDNTLLANLLAGTVDMTLGRGISLEQAQQTAQQWRDGKAVFRSLDIWIVLYPQFLNPTPAIVGNAQFRRALLQAIDRQELVDSIQAGLVPVADSVISPNLALYPDVSGDIVRYAYDPRGAGQTIEGLGYAKAPDGVYRDPGGQRLGVGIQVTTVLDIQPKTAFPVADYWQRVGVGVDVDVVPPQRGQDLEYRATFPSFALQRQPANLRPLQNLHSTQARTPERGYTGSNYARYMSPDMDALIEQYLTTIPSRERTAVVDQIVHQITDQVIWLGLFFDTEPGLIANRLVNVGAKPDDGSQTWNAHDWSVRS